MYFSKDADSVPTFESPWIHRGWTPAEGEEKATFYEQTNRFGIRQPKLYHSSDTSLLPARPWPRSPLSVNALLMAPDENNVVVFQT